MGLFNLLDVLRDDDYGTLERRFILRKKAQYLLHIND